LGIPGIDDIQRLKIEMEDLTTMNLRKLTLVALLAASSMAFATIDLRTTIRDVYIDGTCEETGNITFSVTGDDFANASTMEPVYIRLRLDHAARLCKTLVWSNAANPIDRTELPIFLPIGFEERTLADAILAPAETVSIVRWKKGENEIWLRIQFPTGQWIDRGGLLLPPSSFVRVRWTIGITARTSWTQNKPNYDILVGAGRLANLPSATRDVAGLTEDDAVSTLICVDLSSSNLEALPAPEEVSALNFDPSAWDSTTLNVITAVSSSSIVLGAQLSTSFSNDRIIARGYDFTCSGSFPNKFDGPTARALCATTIADQSGISTFGVVCMTNSITVRILCGGGWGFHEFSRIMLATEAGSRYGFPVEGDGTLDPGITMHSGNWVQLNTAALSLDGLSSSFPYAAASSVFSIQDGTLLSREARIQYLGVGVTGSFTFVMTATVCMWYEEPPDDVILQVTVFASNRDLSQVVDAPPFEGWDGSSTPGFDQERACDPSLRFAFQGQWLFGFFVECRAEACVRIFFPYVPRLRDIDPTVETDFWAGLSFVNQGTRTLNAVYANVYESDGSMWTVDFPSLPVRNQQTYGIWYLDSEGGVVFQNAETGDILVPTTSSADLIFGERRSSMFVTGCYVSEGDLSANGAAVDLDGYLLIGAGGSIDGAYTARNFEISRYDRDPNQDGNLPVQYDKRDLNKVEFHKIEGLAPRAY
jgi:hypothetical protein